MSKVAVFLDVQNLYHSSKTYGGSKISYKHLIEYIGKDREIIEARAYTAHKDPKSSRSFYHALKSAGIEVCPKSVWVKKTASGIKVIPVHFDVEITADALCTPDEVDTIILCTGNGNFSYLVDKLLGMNVSVEIWSFEKSTSDQLKNKDGVTFVEIPSQCLLGSLEE